MTEKNTAALFTHIDKEVKNKVFMLIMNNKVNGKQPNTMKDLVELSLNEYLRSQEN